MSDRPGSLRTALSLAARLAALTLVLTICFAVAGAAVRLPAGDRPAGPEPAGAAALVPLLTGRLTLPPGATVVPIICGGNIDVERLKSLL